MSSLRYVAQVSPSKQEHPDPPLSSHTETFYRTEGISILGRKQGHRGQIPLSTPRRAHLAITYRL